MRDKETKDGVPHDIGWAVHAMRAGKKVSRPAWHGPKQWIRLHKPSHTTNRTRESYISKFYARHENPWFANQDDILAEDWYVVKDKDDHEEADIKTNPTGPVHDIRWAAAKMRLGLSVSREPLDEAGKWLTESKAQLASGVKKKCICTLMMGGYCTAWKPTANDLLATDWYLVDQPKTQ